MPLIFASSLLSLPAAVARYADMPVIDDFAKSIGPGGLLYLPTNIALIVFFNYYYTFLQVRWGTGCTGVGNRVRDGGGVVDWMRSICPPTLRSLCLSTIYLATYFCTLERG